jgi:hypothetical protein
MRDHKSKEGSAEWKQGSSETAGSTVLLGVERALRYLLWGLLRLINRWKLADQNTSSFIFVYIYGVELFENTFLRKTHDHYMV